MSLLLALSFDWYWNELSGNSLQGFATGVEFSVATILTVVSGLLLVRLFRTESPEDVNTKSFAFILFIILFFIGIISPRISQLLVNLIILVFAVNTIRSGAKQNHLGILNYGLLIITALVLCRFFDTDLSFVIRGLLFIAVGAGFFAANFYLIQQRKKAE
jgi:hypothetical protein